LEFENSGLVLKFCGGAVDATEGSYSKDLSPRIYKEALVTVLDDFLVKGLTNEEGVALASRENVGTEFYRNLLDGNGDFTDLELALLQSKDLEQIVKHFASNKKKLLETFSVAWTKMMTADRFLNNRENACSGVDSKTKDKKLKKST